MDYVFRFFLALSALCLTLAVFAANKQIAVLRNFGGAFCSLPPIWSYVLYFLGAVIVSWVSLKIAAQLADDSIAEGALSAAEPANDAYLPSYLGYFFVALSSQDVWVFSFVFGMIYIFVFLSKAGIFNPIYFLFGYQYFYAMNNDGVKILIITKRTIKVAKAEKFEKLKRINEFTFIEL